MMKRARRIFLTDEVFGSASSEALSIFTERQKKPDIRIMEQKDTMTPMSGNLVTRYSVRRLLCSDPTFI